MLIMYQQIVIFIYIYILYDYHLHISEQRKLQGNLPYIPLSTMQGNIQIAIAQESGSYYSYVVTVGSFHCGIQYLR